ncbi:MAG: phosphoribosylformylglycinamidine synthase subunit PurS [Candidatus Diapherotrites archaeon]
MFEIWSVEVCYRPDKRDALGLSVKADIKDDLGLSVESVSFVHVYTINAEITENEAKKIASQLLSDPVIQDYSVNSPLKTNFDWEITVELNPDVTDNVGLAAKHGIEDLLIGKMREDEFVKYSRKYLLKGKLSEDKIKRICEDLLANSVIEKYSYKKGNAKVKK